MPCKSCALPLLLHISLLLDAAVQADVGAGADLVDDYRP